MKKLITIAALAAIAGAAHADFNTGIGAGPYVSDGAAGNADNGVFSFTYTGSNADVFNRIRIRGTATSGGVGSFLSELRWRFVGPTTIDSGAVASGTTWGSASIDNTQTFSNFSLVNGTTYSFRFWESYNDGGIDATWSNVQFDFLSAAPAVPPTAVSIGNFNVGAFDINTFGSNFDTEIGLYSSTGALISNNDDAGAGLQSQITPTLALGTYYIAVGGFNTIFNSAGWDVVGGAASGLFDLNVNGFASIEDQALASGTVKWYSFNVVPTPGSFALLGLAGLAAGRRRR